MRAYHFVNEEYGLQNLQRRRLKIANLDQLNDPFELFSIEMSDEKVRRAFEKMKRDLAENRGILCFSDSWQNPVIWGHYAEQHKGLCLGFDVPDHCLGKVDYSRKRLVADLEKLTNQANLKPDDARQFLFTKYSHWRYEREYRSFVTLEDRDSETGLYFAEFSERLKLKIAIVGARSSLSRADISAALGEMNDEVNVFKARLAFKSFKVVRQRNEELWA